MATYYRIQPIGKPLRPSADMDGAPLDPPGMFVFTSLAEMRDAVRLWSDPDPSKEEVVEIRYSGPSWDHHLESGTLIDPKRARITKRIPLGDVLGKVAMVRELTARFVRAGQPDNAIRVNVFDDDPPGCPILVEGDMPCGVDRDAVREWLAGIATSSGYEVEWYTRRWGDENALRVRFRIRHPWMDHWDGSKHQEAHTSFIQELMSFFRGRAFFPDVGKGEPKRGFPLWVISES